MKQLERRMVRTNATPRWIPTLTVCLTLGVLVALLLLPGTSLLERLRWLDSGLCAQALAHVLYEGGKQLPLCARNTGIYLGFLATVLILHGLRRGRVQQLPPRAIMIVLSSGVLALALDGGNSLLLDLGLPHLYQPQNQLRLATGLVTGLALGALLFPYFNRLVWCEYNEERSIRCWQDVLLFGGALGVLFGMVLSQRSIFLYPIALLSTSGVVLALSSVNQLILVSVCKREESFTTYREGWPFFVLALVCAIAEMLILAQLKLILLHTLGL